jgi:hypothetical protein
LESRSSSKLKAHHLEKWNQDVRWTLLSLEGIEPAKRLIGKSSFAIGMNTKVERPAGFILFNDIWAQHSRSCKSKWR